jgi:endonuclease/exonuclease/phosphatase family metal-dependent hydrolase
MKILTFNLWFEPHAMVKRLQAVIRLLKADLPDVVGLQEVVPETHAELHKSLSALYFVSQAPANSAYFTLLLVRRTWQAVTMGRVPFTNSHMGRDLLYAKIGEDLIVGTVHLESEDNAAKRKAQLQECADFLEQFSSTRSSRILMGDFNFDSDKNYREGKPLENFVLRHVFPDAYKDMWLALAPPEDKGYTLDQKANPWRGTFSVKHRHQYRFDRIMACLLGKWQATNIALWANAPIAEDASTPIFASDHFGVMLTLEEGTAAAASSPTTTTTTTTTFTTPPSASGKKRPSELAYEAAMKRFNATAVIEVKDDDDKA